MFDGDMNYSKSYICGCKIALRAKTASGPQLSAR